MYTVEELHQQNREISQLLDVLGVLVEPRELHNNPFVCELMGRFREKVWIHLVFEDNTVYGELANDPDPEVSATAQRFHDSARRIKKRFAGYVRQYCMAEISDAEHAALLEESREIFAMIRDRVRFEEQYMFPLLERHAKQGAV